MRRRVYSRSNQYLAELLAKSLHLTGFRDVTITGPDLDGTWLVLVDYDTDKTRRLARRGWLEDYPVPGSSAA